MSSSLTDQTSLFDCFYFLRYWGNVFIAIAYFSGCDVKNFEINLIFLIRPFFYMSEKSRRKFKYLENEKSF